MPKVRDRLCSGGRALGMSLSPLVKPWMRLWSLDVLCLSPLLVMTVFIL